MIFWHFSTLNSTCKLMRDCQSRIKADMYRNCEKLYISFRESPITPSETPFPTHKRYTGEELDSERVTCHPPRFFLRNLLGKLFFILYYVIHIKVFTLEKASYLANATAFRELPARSKSRHVSERRGRSNYTRKALDWKRLRKNWERQHEASRGICRVSTGGVTQNNQRNNPAIIKSI